MDITEHRLGEGTHDITVTERLPLRRRSHLRCAHHTDVREAFYEAWDAGKSNLELADLLIERMSS